MKSVKATLRSRLRNERLALRKGEAQVRSSAVCWSVISSPEFEKAECVALYRAMPGEVDTDEIFKTARQRGKVTIYPRVEAGKKDLVFCVVTDLQDMKPGKWDILEPPPEAQQRDISEADLIIVPGVAFDRKGGRLGQGGGFYDRVLKMRKPGAVAMGVAFEIQLVDEVPREPHDELIDCLATETGILRFKDDGGEHC